MIREEQATLFAASIAVHFLALFGGLQMSTRFARRHALRHLLAVDVEVTDLDSGIQIKERTKDLNLYGCGVNTVTPFQAGSNVRLKLANSGQEIIAFGKVIYGRKDAGMGIVFTMLAKEDQKVLNEWFILGRPASNHVVRGSVEHGGGC
jgi:PilZ domain